MSTIRFDTEAATTQRPVPADAGQAQAATIDVDHGAGQALISGYPNPGASKRGTLMSRDYSGDGDNGGSSDANGTDGDNNGFDNDGGNG